MIHSYLQMGLAQKTMQTDGITHQHIELAITTLPPHGKHYWPHTALRPSLPPHTHTHTPWLVHPFLHTSPHTHTHTCTHTHVRTHSHANHHTRNDTMHYDFATLARPARMQSVFPFVTGVWSQQPAIPEKRFGRTHARTHPHGKKEGLFRDLSHYLIFC